MKKRKPHCSHVSHFARCTCSHPHYLHADLDGVGQDEGFCTIKPGRKRCPCDRFTPLPGYTLEQLTHDTVPIEGYDFTGGPLGKLRVVQK